jgi:hypothetical protein
MKIAIVLRCLFYHRDVRNDTHNPLLKIMDPRVGTVQFALSLPVVFYAA